MIPEIFNEISKFQTKTSMPHLNFYQTLLHFFPRDIAQFLILYSQGIVEEQLDFPELEERYTCVDQTENPEHWRQKNKYHKFPREVG